MIVGRVLLIAIAIALAVVGCLLWWIMMYDDGH